MNGHLKLSLLLLTMNIDAVRGRKNEKTWRHKNLKTQLSNDGILWLVCTNCRTRWPDEPLGLPASGPTSPHLQMHRREQHHIWNASNNMIELQELFTSQWVRHNLSATLWLTITDRQAISDGSTSCFKYNISSLHTSHTNYNMPYNTFIFITAQQTLHIFESSSAYVSKTFALKNVWTTQNLHF